METSTLGEVVSMIFLTPESTWGNDPFDEHIISTGLDLNLAKIQMRWTPILKDWMLRFGIFKVHIGFVEVYLDVPGS